MKALARYLVHEECPAFHTNKCHRGEMPTPCCCDCEVGVQKSRRTALTAEALAELGAAIEGAEETATTAVSVGMCFMT